jgi:hypothetical protein
LRCCCCCCWCCCCLRCCRQSELHMLTCAPQP